MWIPLIYSTYLESVQLFPREQNMETTIEMKRDHQSQVVCWISLFEGSKMKCLFNFILRITNITPLISLVASRNTFRFPLLNLSGLDPNWIDDYAWPLLLSFVQFLFKTKISAKPTSVSCPWDFFSFSCLSFTFFPGIEIFESSAFPVTSAQVGSGVPWAVFIINESFSAAAIQQKCYLNYTVCIYIYRERERVDKGYTCWMVYPNDPW